MSYFSIICCIVKFLSSGFFALAFKISISLCVSLFLKSIYCLFCPPFVPGLMIPGATSTASLVSPFLTGGNVPFLSFGGFPVKNLILRSSAACIWAVAKS